jgi:DNA mismatch endonuclease, patch repair protein
MDIVSRRVRSAMMSRIQSKNTKPELVVRKFLFARGFRFRLHDKNLPGSPDLIFKLYRAAVFVHGCFWHRHPGCRYATTPASNYEFWQKKFGANVRRDSDTKQTLLLSGWRVATVWECALDKKVVSEKMEVLCKWLPDIDSRILELGE